MTGVSITQNMERLDSLYKQVNSLPLNYENPHEIANSAVQMSILLADMTDCVLKLENSEGDWNGAKSWQKYIKSKETLVIRIEKYIESKIKLESKQI